MSGIRGPDHRITSMIVRSYDLLTWIDIKVLIFLVECYSLGSTDMTYDTNTIWHVHKDTVNSKTRIGHNPDTVKDIDIRITRETKTLN